MFAAEGMHGVGVGDGVLMCPTQPYNRASQRTSLSSWAWVGHAAVQLAGSTHRPHSKAQVAWKDLSQSPWLQSIHMPGFPHKQQVYRCAEGAELEGRRRGMQVTYDCVHTSLLSW